MCFFFLHWKNVNQFTLTFFRSLHGLVVDLTKQKYHLKIQRKFTTITFKLRAWRKR